MKCYPFWNDALSCRPFSSGLVRAAFCFALVLQQPCSGQGTQATPPDAQLLRVLTKGSQEYIGQLQSNRAESVTLYDLISKSTVDIAKNDVAEVDNPVSMEVAARRLGIPKLLGWRTRLLADESNQIGKIAKITSPTIYLTLGQESGIRIGSRVNVYRNQGEIKHPDSGEVIGVDRPRISQLEVTEVQSRFSKARLATDIETSLEVGDEVELDQPLVVAIAPIYDERGNRTNIGANLEEQLTTSLVQSGVKVVERSVIDAALEETTDEKKEVYGTQASQTLGLLTQANYVVVGKIVRRQRRGSVYVRLLNVATGQIVLAIFQEIDLSSATTIDAIGEGNGPETGEPNRSRDGITLGKGRALPSFLTSNSRYKRADGGGIRIEGYETPTVRTQGAIRTKKTGYIDGDFDFSVVLEFGIDDSAAQVGLGGGEQVGTYNALDDSVYVHIPSPTLHRHSKGEVRLYRYDKGNEVIGNVKTNGPHRVRVLKEGETVTFQIDVGNDGPTPDDVETIIPNISEFAPFLHSKNSPLFFAGGGRFQSVAISRD